MFRIVKKVELADKVKEFVVEAPLIARAAKPGNFVLVRGDEYGERLPLTIADSDTAAGTITLVLQEVGQGTVKLGAFHEGESYSDVVGPLGKNREINGGGHTICCVAGGLGVAPMYPQTKAYHEAGDRVISIIGARSRNLLFWQDKMAAVSDEVYYGTDDGSYGFHGFATQILEDLIQKGEKFDEVVAIGPVPHMRAVTECCKKQRLRRRPRVRRRARGFRRVDGPPGSLPVARAPGRGDARGRSRTRPRMPLGDRCAQGR